MKVNEAKTSSSQANETDDELKATHTPGPWEYVETGPGANVAAGRFKISQHWQGTASSDELRANARLIAAAPELLFTLKRSIFPTGHTTLCNRFQGESETRVCLPECMRVHLIIDKATGEQQWANRIARTGKVD